MFSSSVSIQYASHPLMLTRRSICTFALSYRGLKKTKKAKQTNKKNTQNASVSTFPVLMKYVDIYNQVFQRIPSD